MEVSTGARAKVGLWVVPAAAIYLIGTTVPGIDPGAMPEWARSH